MPELQTETKIYHELPECGVTEFDHIKHRDPPELFFEVPVRALIRDEVVSRHEVSPWFGCFFDIAQILARGPGFGLGAGSLAKCEKFHQII